MASIDGPRPLWQPATLLLLSSTTYILAINSVCVCVCVCVKCNVVLLLNENVRNRKTLSKNWGYFCQTLVRLMTRMRKISQISTSVSPPISRTRLTPVIWKYGPADQPVRLGHLLYTDQCPNAIAYFGLSVVAVGHADRKSNLSGYGTTHSPTVWLDHFRRTPRSRPLLETGRFSSGNGPAPGYPFPHSLVHTHPAPSRFALCKWKAEECRNFRRSFTSGIFRWKQPEVHQLLISWQLL